jgi:hypothetical protein
MTKDDWLAAGAYEHQAASDWSMTKKMIKLSMIRINRKKYINIFFSKAGGNLEI